MATGLCTVVLENKGVLRGGPVRAPVPVLIVQWVSTEGGVPPRGYLAMPSDISGCHH